MTLRFIGVDPDTKSGGSPTVWVDEDTAEIVIQGWKINDALRRRVEQNPAPDHAAGIPATEDVVRLPARMAPILKEACNAAIRLG
ncbi:MULTISPECIES: hypothetical protein [Streptacidiphilus]|uniref:DUF429 domain-containing protein n=1 Tax=Streptacidiphilus cavernicola TaxID=3342716 RepID=A0ABV6UXP1_9ACTN|nr:hypothetical protein [Streptacidiphilus jeojiense]